MGSSEHVIQSDCNIHDRVSKKSPFQKRYQMFEQLVFVATAVEKDLFQLTSYTLSTDNLKTCIQKSVQGEYCNKQMSFYEKNDTQNSSPILNVTHIATERPEAKKTDTNNEIAHIHVTKRKLKCKHNYLKKTKIAPDESPHNFVYVTKAIRVKYRTNSASKPQVRSIMKYRF
ncbi:hypothetical protein Gasu2_12130 [Galdieria sulphuraria]|nr:hypothetical protein Gasu2_12130 [Galdieria sulphuraria]